MITFRSEELQIPERAGIYKIFRKVMGNYSQPRTPENGTDCSQQTAVEMLTTVFDNC